MSSNNFTPFVFVNGLLFPQIEASLPANDLAILRGYGVFDYFLINNGQPLFFEDHWDRLQQSAAALQLRLPFSKEDVLRMVKILHAKMPYPLGGVRITLTGGCSPDGYLPGEAANSLVTLQPHAGFPETLSPQGIGLMTHEYRRAIPVAKSIDYMMGILMQPIAKQKGFQDILYVLDGKVSECPRSNIFAVTRKNELITPVDGVLNGITRKRVLKHSSTMMNVDVRAVYLHEMLVAKEVFITSTNKGIWTVGQIDDQQIGDGKPGPVASKLYKLLMEEIMVTAS